MESSHCARVVAGSTPKAPIVVRLFERAVQISARPFDIMSRVASRSATRIGWFQASITEAIVRNLIRLVCGAIAAYSTSGAETEKRGGLKCCSEVPQVENPRRSANFTSSTSW